MCETSLSVWFVCRLCRGSFGQVDAFIEHKKQKHFTQFQNTTSIVFEEREHGPLYTVISSGDHQLADEFHELQVKPEVKDDDPTDPFTSEIIDEPNLAFFEVKSEPITFESEINPDNKNNFFGLKQPEQNPYVLLKRLTSEEIQEACGPQGPPQHTSFFKCAQKIFAKSLDLHNSSDANSNISDRHEVANTPEMQSTATVVNISTKDDPQVGCKLCSRQFQSDALLKIHVGICALYHEDRNRFCVICNRKLSNTFKLKAHHLTFHGTEEEKLSLYKFKCHVCSKQFKREVDLRFHLESHKTEKQKKDETSNLELFKCSHPNCKKIFRFNYVLQKHISEVHLDARPFSCSFSNCNKKCKQRSHLEAHLRTHTGERPFKCTVDNNCNKAFRTSSQRSNHHQNVHCNL